MTTIEERRRRRFEFLKHFYETTGGDGLTMIAQNQIGAELGWDEATTDQTAQYLSDAGLLKYVAMGGFMSITHEGVKQVESALAHPNEQTEFFPAVVNIYGGDHVVLSGEFKGTIVNIGSILSSVRQTIASIPRADESARKELNRLLQRLDGALNDIPPEQAAEAEAVARSAKTLVDAIAEEKPNGPFVEISKEGLIKASKNLAAVMPIVVTIATQIAEVVGGLVV